MKNLIIPYASNVIERKILDLYPGMGCQELDTLSHCVQCHMDDMEQDELNSFITSFLHGEGEYKIIYETQLDNPPAGYEQIIQGYKYYIYQKEDE